MVETDAALSTLPNLSLSKGVECNRDEEGKQNNTIRCLEKRNDLHQVVEYDMMMKGIFLPSMFQVSGIPVDMLYMTIVCRGDKTGVILAFVPGIWADMKVGQGQWGNKRW